MASSVSSEAPLSTSARRRSFQRSSARCAAFSMPGSVVRYTVVKGPRWSKAAATEATSAALIASWKVGVPVVSMPRSFPVRSDGQRWDPMLEHTPVGDADDPRVADYRHLTDVALRKAFE